MLTVAALALALQVAGRPEGLVRPGEEAEYGAFLKGEAVIAARILSGRTCEAFEVTGVSSEVITLTNTGAAYPVPAANERVTLEGCGMRHVHNVLVARYEEVPGWVSKLGVAGESQIDIVQQRALIPEILGLASRNLGVSCDTGNFVVDTYVAANRGNIAFYDQQYSPADPTAASVGYGQYLPDPSDDVVLAEAWAEVWTLQLCGQDYANLIFFIPTRDGRLTRRYANLTPVAVEDRPQRTKPLG